MKEETRLLGWKQCNHACVYIYIYTYLRTTVELRSHVIKSSYIRVIPTDTQVKGKSD